MNKVSKNNFEDVIDIMIKRMVLLSAGKKIVLDPDIVNILYSKINGNPTNVDIFIKKMKNNEDVLNDNFNKARESIELKLSLKNIGLSISNNKFKKNGR